MKRARKKPARKSLRREVDGLRATLAAWGKWAKAEAGKIRELREECAGLHREVDYLRGQVVALRDEIAGHSSRLDGHAAKTKEAALQEVRRMFGNNTINRDAL